MNPGILQDITVLDLTRFYSGPQCTLLLAGMGAEVIKIDDPRGGDPTADAPPFAGPHGVALERRSDDDLGVAYLKRMRGKKSVLLDLKRAEGRALLLRLVATADVLVENFRVGVTDRLGIDYDRLKAINPRLVYCSITGYGMTGPDRDEKAYDSIVQASAGLMGITGHPDSGPVKAGSALSDGIAGTFAALGVMAALHDRSRTGQGQLVDVSMADCLFSLLFDEPIDCYQALGMPFQQGNRIMRFSPFNSYRSADGWVVIGVATSADWDALLRAMAREDLVGHAQWSNVGWRIANNAEVDALVGAFTARLATAEVLAMLRAAGVACAEVRSGAAVLAWPQLAARGMLQALVHPRLGSLDCVRGPGFPLKFGATPAAHRAGAPLPGGDTETVLRERLGLDAAELARLKESGVV